MSLLTDIAKSMNPIKKSLFDIFVVVSMSQIYDVNFNIQIIFAILFVNKFASVIYSTYVCDMEYQPGQQCIYNIKSNNMEFEMPKLEELQPGNFHNVTIILDFDAPVNVVVSAPGEINSLNVDKMKKGYSHFRYKKKDGSVREAFGTLNANLMPVKNAEPGEYEKGLKRSSATSQSYFDIEANDWRAYVIMNLITVF